MIGRRCYFFDFCIIGFRSWSVEFFDDNGFEREIRSWNSLRISRVKRRISMDIFKLCIYCVYMERYVEREYGGLNGNGYYNGSEEYLVSFSISYIISLDDGFLILDIDFYLSDEFL